MRRDERELQALLAVCFPQPAKNFDEVLRRSGFAAGQPAAVCVPTRPRAAHIWRIAALVGGCAAVTVAAVTVWHQFRHTTPPPIAEPPVIVTTAATTEGATTTATAAPTTSTTTTVAETTTTTVTTTTPPTEPPTTLPPTTTEPQTLDSDSFRVATMEEVREQFDSRLRETDNEDYMDIMRLRDDDGVQCVIYRYYEKTKTWGGGCISIVRAGWNTEWQVPPTDELTFNGRTFLVTRDDPLDIYYMTDDYVFSANFDVKDGWTQEEVLEELDKLIF